MMGGLLEDAMATEPPFPTEERPGVWRTRWRPDTPVNGRRPQYTQRFYGSRTQITREYKRWLKRWQLDGAVQHPLSAEGLTVADLADAYLAHAQGWYVKGGRPTSRVWNIKSAMQRLIDRFGDTPANGFTPPMLAQFRDELDKPGAKRETINAWLTIIRQAWAWGAEQGHADPDVALRLTTVKLLQRGRCRSDEYQVVDPVHWSVVEATAAAASPMIRAMILIQWHAGMRPGEVCVMRTGDIDIGGAVWLYRPRGHKTEHHDKARVVALGPQAQAILAPRLKPDLAAYLFSPAEAEAERLAALHARRKTPLSCGNRPGSNPGRGRRPMRASYTPDSYRQAIERVCDAAFPPPKALARRKVAGKRGHTRWETPQEWQARLGERWAELEQWRKDHRWNPNQIRHAKEAALEKAEGLEASRLVLGHSGEGTTRKYGQRERELRELEQIKALAQKYG